MGTEASQQEEETNQGEEDTNGAPEAILSLSQLLLYLRWLR